MLEQLYRKYSSESGSARDLLTQTHWYSSIAVFDPRTHEAFPQPLSALLRKIAEQEKLSPAGKSWALKDRLWRIIVHAKDSLTRLFRNLNESLFRDHAVLPLRAVRELDSSSFMALSRRPGRNVREKLSDKPYLQAVRRYQSVDLPENSLLKTFAERLAELLELRVEYLHDQESDELLYQIHSWLTTDEAKSIRRWENLPPNNTLLSHKDYRHIYDSWRWLQSLDDDLEMDMKNFSVRQKTMQDWREYGKMYAKSMSLFAEEPVLFDYDKFEIRFWGEQPRIQRMMPFSRPKEIMSFDAPVCIDLAQIYPRYAFLTGTEASPCVELPYPFIWQRWENEESPVPSFDIDLFNADAVNLHPDTTTVSAPDLFFSKNQTPEYLGFAAQTFAKKLRETFKNDVLLWLQPDYLNDFELKITRSNINACFPKAEPLPRSVAAAIEIIDYQSLREGYVVLVTDTVGGKLYVTKLEAKFDPELYKRLPKETRGFYWERHPSIIVPNNNACDNSQTIYDIYSVDEKQKWLRPQKPHINNYISKKTIQDNQIGHFDRIINASDSPVCGGVKLYAMQQRAGDIPLWRDQIPELKIKAKVNGRYQPFYLVPKKTTVKPIRGQAVDIPLNRNLVLPAGIERFRLYLGENEDEIDFYARLESPQIPLQKELECKLKMEFTYGADDPYSLVFIPATEESISPIRVKWENANNVIITNAPAPEYPEPMDWDGLQSFHKRDSVQTCDLLEWTIDAAATLDRQLYLPMPKRTTGAIIDKWRFDVNGNCYNYAYCDDVDETIFINQTNFIDQNDDSYFQENYLSLISKKDKDGGYVGRRVAPLYYQEPKKLKTINDNLLNSIIGFIHKSLYFPFIQIWRDSRSIDNALCPPEFKNAMTNIIVYFDSLIQQDDIPQPIKDEIIFILSCMHKDTTQRCIQWIERLATNINACNDIGKADRLKTIDPRIAIGFALGDVSKPWQKKVFESLKANLANNPYHSLRIFTYAIWREEHFIENFNYSECLAILEYLNKRLSNIQPWKNNVYNNQWTISKWELELLFGMLRTRNSSNEEIKMLLQPHQKITKELAKQVERITNIVVKNKINMSSRIQFGDLDKNADDPTPDLLFALNLYLAGEDSANAIRITSVSDSVVDEN